MPNSAAPVSGPASGPASGPNPAPFAADVAVIGAGVVGLAIAHRLARAGRDVLLIDPDAPGSGASYGNAGTIADYAVQPVGTPSVLRALPALLFDADSPLAIHRGAALGLVPWLIRFLRQSLPGAARANATVLAQLLHDACARWQALAGQIGATDLLQPRGCLYLYDSPARARAAQADLAFRRSLGVAVESLDGAALAALEPGLPAMAGAAFFPRAVFLSDPGQMVARLAAAAFGAGARRLGAKVLAIAPAQAPGPGGWQLDLGPEGPPGGGAGPKIRVRHLVLASGAHGRALARQLGDRVPLKTERGYHVEWDGAAVALQRPACPVAQGFYLCPMQGRLRVAGTVELGGLDAPPSAHRIARLTEGARRLFPDLPEQPDRVWMGFRPSIPDSLPVVGLARACAQAGAGLALHAYGHGHIGLTLAPITAELVAGLLGADPDGAQDPIAPARRQALLEALSPQRF